MDEDVAAAQLVQAIVQPALVAFRIAGDVDRSAVHLAGACRVDFPDRRLDLGGIAREERDIRALGGEMAQRGETEAMPTAVHDDLLAGQPQIHRRSPSPVLLQAARLSESG